MPGPVLPKRPLDDFPAARMKAKTVGLELQRKPAMSWIAGNAVGKSGVACNFKGAAACSNARPGLTPVNHVYGVRHDNTACFGYMFIPVGERVHNP